MSKKLLILFAVMSIVLPIISLNVNAAESGYCGDTLKWRYEEGTLTITGTGEMTDYSSVDRVPWYQHMADITEIFLPEELVSIGDYAFWYTNIENIEIPQKVKRVGSGAFRECLMLKEVTISNSVTEIGDYAFYGCTSLENITLPEYLKTIERSAFSGCTKLSKVYMADNITTIEYGAFYNCSIEYISLSDSLTTIGEIAFKNCKKLKQITFPEGFLSMGKEAFSNCTSLTKIQIPESVIDFGNYAFSGCTALSSVTLHSKLTFISHGAFAGCTGLRSITLHKSTTYISTQAFYGCTNLTDVYYFGTAVNWATLSIASYNDSLTAAKIHYMCTLTYDPSGGSYGPPPQTFELGQKVRISQTIPVKAGYSFVEWNTKSDGTGTKVYYASDTVWSFDKSLTVYAIWKENPSVKITFNDNNIVTVTARCVEEGNMVILAVYDGNKLLNIQMNEYKGEPIDFTETSAYTKAKAMVWKTFDSLIPKCNVAEKIR